METNTQSLEAAPVMRTEKIGTVNVDSGQIVILDPCRAEELHDDADGKVSLTEQLGKFVVRCCTGLGDGRYPVFADIVDFPQFGTRVAALHIHFDPIYCFADDPKYAAKIVQREAEYLDGVNNS